MSRCSFLSRIGASLALWILTSPATAEQPDARAGCPQQVAWYARPSDTPQYIGYYIGGGAAVGGACRCSDEGTWGWDYRGRFLLHRVVLFWSHGGRYQGGAGAYKTDGPPVPDVPALVHSAAHAPFRKSQVAAVGHYAHP